MTDRTATSHRAGDGVPRLTVSVGRLRVGAPLSRWERAALTDAIAAALTERYATGVDAEAPATPGAPLAGRVAAAVHQALPAELPGGAT
jgi:hypothetical protein